MTDSGDSEDSDSPNPPAESHWRMDLTSEVVDVEEEDDGVRATFAMEPDSDRYDRIETDDFTGWYDTQDNVRIPEDVLKQMWTEQMEDTPIYHSPDKVGDFQKYTNELATIASGLLADEFVIPPIETDTEVLDQIRASDDPPTFVIIKVDLVDSTTISARYRSEYQKIVSIFEYVIVHIIRSHNGFYLTKEGDGIFGFFSSPNVVGKHDNAAVCVVRIYTIIKDLLGPLYEEYGYPNISVSIGMDTGNPDIVPAGNDFDLMGLTLNLASIARESDSD